MAHDRISPPDLFDSRPYGFSQVVSAAGQRTIFCAGQTAWDASCNIVGPGDFRTQMTETLRNVERALKAAGAALSDVTRLVIYVPDYNTDHLPVIGECLTASFGRDLPANSVVGVAALALPEFIVEIEATAVVAA